MRSVALAFSAFFLICLPIKSFSGVVYLQHPKDSIDRFLEDSSLTSNEGKITLAMSYKSQPLPPALSRNDLAKLKVFPAIDFIPHNFYETYFRDYLPNGYILLGKSESFEYSFPEEEVRDQVRKVGAYTVLVVTREIRPSLKVDKSYRYHFTYYFLGKIR